MTTEKEWWFDDLLPAFSEDYAPDKPFLKECIKRIVQEQKKRDWEEFRGIIDELIEENKHLMERDPELDAGMNYVRDVLRIRTANRLQD